VNNDNIFFDLGRLKYCGKNVIIGKCVRIRYPELVSIDDNSIIDDFTYISTSLEVGKYVHIASNVTISGGADSLLRIGDLSGIAAGSSIYTGSEDYVNMTSFSSATIPSEFRIVSSQENICIGKHVWIGAHSILMPGVVLPDGFACAAGTIVRKKKYYSWTLYGGENSKKLVERQHDLYDQRVKKLYEAVDDE